MESTRLITPLLSTAAVLLWCGRGFWRTYPAWTFYGLTAVAQTWSVLMSGIQESGALWTLFTPLLLAAQFDAVLELFLKLSHLYRRFHRDRWKWLVLPVMLGCLVGLLIVYKSLSTASDLYRTMFLAQAVVGTMCASVLIIGWLASIPIRIPANLRTHMQLLAVYVGTGTIAYGNYLNAKDYRALIRTLLMFVPPLVMVAWGLLMQPDEERELTLEEMPESTLDQLLNLLKRIG
jgi:hypothetical protein